MDVTKIREVLIKASNERKAVKKDKESGVSEFKYVLDNHKKSSDDEVKPKALSQEQKKSESGFKTAESADMYDSKAKVSQSSEDTDKTDKTETNAVAAQLLQPIAQEAAKAFNLENSNETVLKILSQADTKASAINVSSTLSEGVSQLSNLLKQISGQINNGQTVSKEFVEGKINELGNKLQGLIPLKSFENIKQQLIDFIQGDNTAQVVNSETKLNSMESIIKNELAQILSNKSMFASDIKKSISKVDSELVLNETSLTTEQKAASKGTAAFDSFKLKVDLKEKLTEPSTSLNKQTAFSSEDKAEKLLKSLLSQDKGKGQSDGVNDKLFNFLTRFDSVNDVNAAKLQEGLTVHRNTFSQDIIKAVKFMETNELKDLTVKIAPKELGEVIIKLTMDKGVMKASLSTSSKEAFSILNSNLSELNNKLNQSDIKIQEFSISIYNGDTTFFSEEFNRQNHQQHEERNEFKVSGLGKDSSLDISEKEAADTSNVNILA